MICKHYMQKPISIWLLMLSVILAYEWLFSMIIDNRYCLIFLVGVKLLIGWLSLCLTSLMMQKLKEYEWIFVIVLNPVVYLVNHMVTKFLFLF